MTYTLLIEGIAEIDVARNIAEHFPPLDGFATTIVDGRISDLIPSYRKVGTEVETEGEIEP